MTEIDKIMVDDGNGGQKQIYPQSHAEAIIDLEKFIKAHGGGTGGTGEKGYPGLSAYEVAQENGYTGTEKEWLASLKGADGKNGADGKQGPAGKDGAKGETGAQGPKGDKGDQGEKGEPGDSTIKLIKVKDV